MSKNTIIKGTVILTASGILTKLLGFYNRIFLTRLIGVRELGVYQLIFPIYLLAYSFCCQGIATTLTKHVSYYMGRQKNENIKKSFYMCLSASCLAGLLISLIIYNAAYPLSLYVLKNTECAVLLKIIAVAIPFVSAKGCINAYFIGVSKPCLHGFSHLFEQIIRIATAAVLAELWSVGKINAALAVYAVVAGEISAAVLAMIFYNIYIAKNKENVLQTNKKADTNAVIAKKLVRDIAPITMNNIIFTLFSSFEAVIMPTMLFKYYGDSGVSMEMYGIITGIVVPFLLFPSTITTALSTMLLPAVSYANAKNDEKKIRAALFNSVMFCLVLGVGAWFVFLLLGEPACVYAFESAKAGELLKRMSFLCPLIYLSGTLSAIMNGIDKAAANLIYNITGISIRIIISLTLVPKLGIPAYIAGMTVSYTVIDAMLMTACFKKSKRTNP